MDGIGSLSDVTVLKMVLRDIQDNNFGNSGEFMGYEITERKKEILCAVFELVEKTKYLKPDTVAFLKGKGSYRHCNHVSGGAENKNTSRSRIYYDIGKLKKVLGERLAVSVLEANDKELQEIKDRLDEIKRRYRKSSLLDGFGIKITNPVECTQLSKEEEKEFFRIVRLYSKTRMKYVEELLNTKYAGYVLYLEEEMEKADPDTDRMWDYLAIKGDLQE